jgi:uncharacterized protein
VAVCLLIAALALHLAASALPGDARIPAGLALGVVALVVARMTSLSMTDLGLARDTWRAGLLWGGAAAALVMIGYAAALVITDNMPEPRYDSWSHAVFAALVLIPIGTVIPEELVFRGVVWGLIRRARGAQTATIASSLLFGLWHVVPALGGGPANDALAGAVGSGSIGTVLSVLATVVVTSVAGVVLCVVRQRSDSLLAPVLLHWAVNAGGVLFVLVA